MSLIAKSCGIDITDRKITNHSGRKMLIQGLQGLGVSKEDIALQSRHRSLEGINAYTLSPEQQHYNMLNKFANMFYSKNQPEVRSLYFKHIFLFLFNINIEN